MTDADITKIYSGPVQGGGDLPYFAGKQYGGNGWVRTIGRFAFPILRRILSIAMNTGQDLIEGRKDFKSSLVDNAKREIPTFFTGEGSKRKRSINSALDDIPGSIFAKKRRRRRQ